jgi:hypothetical protein
MLNTNGLWLDLDGFHPADGGGLKNPADYCFVEGVFRPGQKGHFGMWGGEITHITRIERSRGKAIRRSTP